MTNREFFEAVKNGISNAGSYIATPSAEIDKMNAHRNEKRVLYRVANEPIKAKILEFFLTEKNEQILTSVIGEAVGGPPPQGFRSSL